MLDVVFAWDTIVTRLGCRFPCLNQAVCGSGRPRVGCEAVGSRFEAAKRKQRRPSFELRSRVCPISAVTNILFRYPEIDTRTASSPPNTEWKWRCHIPRIHDHLIAYASPTDSSRLKASVPLPLFKMAVLLVEKISPANQRSPELCTLQLWSSKYMDLH